MKNQSRKNSIVFLDKITFVPFDCCLSQLIFGWFVSIEIVCQISHTSTRMCIPSTTIRVCILFGVKFSAGDDNIDITHALVGSQYQIRLGFPKDILHHALCQTKDSMTNDKRRP